MPKAKIHSGAAKRFKKTAGGYKRKSAYKSHIPHEDDDQAKASVARYIDD